MKPCYDQSGQTVICGDAREVLPTLEARSIHCCVTSPPYWGLRDYGTDGQLGLESTPEEYVARMVEVFGEVRRVLRDDGTLWLNLGDSYTTGPSTSARAQDPKSVSPDGAALLRVGTPPGLKPKDLVGIPWRVAFALQADGWYLRSDIIWSKPNPMPESVTDRPTKAHEYVFLFSKSQRYYYDASAIAELCDPKQFEHNQRYAKEYAVHTAKAGNRQPGNVNNVGIHQRAAKITRNARTVWEITTQPYSGAHFATMPAELASRCIKAGSKSRDTVLDPFGGSGTTAAIATGLGRNAIHIDLTYHDLARDRIGPMLVDVKEVAA